MCVMYVMYVYMHVCMHACMHVCMYACMYACRLVMRTIYVNMYNICMHGMYIHLEIIVVWGHLCVNLLTSHSFVALLCLSCLSCLSFCLPGFGPAQGGCKRKYILCFSTAPRAMCSRAGSAPIGTPCRCCALFMLWSSRQCRFG